MEILYNILDAYAYEIVFVDRNHIVRYMNKTAKQRYGSRVQVGNSLFIVIMKIQRKELKNF